MGLWFGMAIVLMAHGNEPVRARATPLMSGTYAECEAWREAAEQRPVPRVDPIENLPVRGAFYTCSSIDPTLLPDS